MAHGKNKHVRKRGRERGGGGRKEGKWYSPSAKTMSKISLLVSFDETGSVAVAGVEDLVSSWVITGMAIVVNGMTMTSR
jgi:hypothetical protein